MEDVAIQERRWISGFWRRVGALVLDGLILGVCGYLLGLVFEAQFVALAGWGRLVGFCIALMYFGVMNSSLAGGQTIGKKVANIKVVNADNHSIGVLRSFVRYSILGIPFFLNGAWFSTELLKSPWLYPFSLIVFGGIVSTVYLYVFNRKTRQSLHDLVVGTFVVNAAANKQEVAAVWRLHLIVVGVVMLAAALVPAYTSELGKSEPFSGMLSAQKALLGNPEVTYALVSSGKSTTSSSNGTTKTTTYVAAQLFLAKNDINDSELARKLAETLANSNSDSIQKDIMVINLTYGFDIGISSRWSSQSYRYQPSDFSEVN